MFIFSIIIIILKLFIFLGDDKSYHPAPWISGDRMESQPSYIWYWMKEGPLKGSISVSGKVWVLFTKDELIEIQ